MKDQIQIQLQISGSEITRTEAAWTQWERPGTQMGRRRRDVRLSRRTKIKRTKAVNNHLYGWRIVNETRQGTERKYITILKIFWLLSTIGRKATPERTLYIPFGTTLMRNNFHHWKTQDAYRSRLPEAREHTPDEWKQWTASSSRSWTWSTWKWQE